MNRNRITALLITSAFSCTGAAQAATITVNENATKTIAISSTLAQDTIGQTFVPTEGRLDSLGFRFGSSTSVTTGNLTLRIYEGAIAAGSSLPSTPLFEDSYALTGLVFRRIGSFSDLATGGLAVNPNTAYTAVLTGSSNIVLAFGSGEGYAPGYLLQTKINDPVCQSTPAACDASFRFTTAIPEPASWALMMTGTMLAASALRYRRRRTTVVVG